MYTYNLIATIRTKYYYISTMSVISVKVAIGSPLPSVVVSASLRCTPGIVAEFPWNIKKRKRLHSAECTTRWGLKSKFICDLQVLNSRLTLRATVLIPYGIILYDEKTLPRANLSLTGVIKAEIIFAHDSTRRAMIKGKLDVFICTHQEEKNKK